MAVVINEMEVFGRGGYAGFVTFEISKTGGGNRDDRWLAFVRLNEFNASTNIGKWESGWRFVGRNLDFTNAIAWSSQGTFKRLSNSLYFYSDNSRRSNAQTPDFALYLAPAFPQDVLNNWGGVGKITNPRNPSWRGIALEWNRSDGGPPPDEE